MKALKGKKDDYLKKVQKMGRKKIANASSLLL
jgi:hypothetical protein